MKNYYKILGVSESADKEKILDAYLKLLKKFREKSKDNTLVRNNLVLITEAFNTLSNSSKRSKYDKKYHNYLDNKDRIDRENKEEKIRKRQERERKKQEEAESKKKQEAESKKKQESESKKKQESESKKKQESDSKKKQEEESKKNKKKEESTKKETKSSDSVEVFVDFVSLFIKKIRSFIKASKFSFFLSCILVTVLIIVLVSRCSKEETTEPPKPEVVEPTHQPYGTLDRILCTGTTRSRKLHDGKGGFYYETIEKNSKDCGYIEPPVPGPQYTSRGTYHSTVCRGTTRSRKLHDGKGGFYYQTIKRNSKDCGYVAVAPIETKNWRLKIDVRNGKGKSVAKKDNIRVYVLKNTSPSSYILTPSGIASYSTSVRNIDLSRHPGAKYILVKGSRRNKSCDLIKPIGNIRSMKFICREF